MSQDNTEERGILTIKREFTAPRQAVFDAFTQPDLMNQWFHAFPKGEAKTEADLRVGGSYKISMIPYPSDDGDKDCGCGSHDHYGEYLEIDPPKKLVFTWRNDGFVEYSLVTLLFEETGPSQTTLFLSHDVPAPTVDAHRQGWTGCLDNLELSLLKVA